MQISENLGSGRELRQEQRGTGSSLRGDRGCHIRHTTDGISDISDIPLMAYQIYQMYH